MSKILFVIDTLNIGGSEKSILETARRLQKFEPVVCHLYPGDTLAPAYEAAGIKVISLKLPGRYNFLKAIRRLQLILKEEKPQLVIGTLVRSEIVSRIACRLENIPTVGTFVSDKYNPLNFGQLPWRSRIQEWMLLQLNRMTTSIPRAFISNASCIKESNVKILGISPKKVKVIYRGRDPEAYKGRRPSSDTSKKISFITVARLSHRKGLRELIEAFARFHKRHPASQLTIAGEGGLRSTLEQKVRKLGLSDSVRLPGYVTDISGPLRESSCFVFPSYLEGFSGAVIEAMLAGIPILASDIPATREAVRHQESAYLFPIMDAGALCEALCWFAENREAAVAMARRARREAETRFDINLIARQHEAFYRKIISGG